MMVGGAEDDVAAARPVLEVIGGTLTHLGPLGAGALAKLCNQTGVAGTLSSLGEALGLARAGGIDPGQLVQVLSGGPASSEVLAQAVPTAARDVLRAGRARRGQDDHAAVQEFFLDD